MGDRGRAAGDQLPPEIGEGGKDPEDQLARRGGGVDRCTVTGEDLRADAASCAVEDGVDQVVEVAAEPVGLPEFERVTGANRLRALRQSRTVISPTGRPVLVAAFVVDASLEEGVLLRIGGQATADGVGIVVLTRRTVRVRFTAA